MSETGTGSERTLDEALRRAPMTVDEGVAVASTVAEEVAALHAAGRAHGGVAPSTVAIDDDGVPWLIGPPAPKTGPAAPPALRAEDLHGVGRVLAATLGWPDRDALPAPVADLVARAEASDAPVAALAVAVRRLASEPLAVAALLPQVAPPVAARQHESLGGTLLGLIPSADRRTTGTAAIVVAAAAAAGAVLLLIGTPASQGRGPSAAAESRPSASADAPASDADAVVADAEPRSLQAILRSGTPRVQPLAAKAPKPDVRAAAPAVEVVAPTVKPSAVPSATTAPAAPVPTPTTAPSTAPTTPTTTPTQAPAPAPTTEPSAPESAPAPSQPAQPSAAPSAPPAEAPPAPASTQAAAPTPSAG